MTRFGSAVLLCLAAVGLVGCGGGSSSPSSPTPSTRVISLSGTLAFGDVAGGTTRDLSFTVSNSGTAALTVSAITGPNGFVADWTSGSIAPGGSQTVTVRFTPTIDQSYAGTMTVTNDATAGGNTISVSGRGIRTGRVVDPMGDAPVGLLSTSPDLVEADVRAAGGVLSIVVTFATGTFSEQDLGFTVYLDIDENPLTGRPGLNSVGADSSIIGVEYFLSFKRPRSATAAEIVRMRPSSGSDTTGTTPVTFNGSERASLAVPLSALGGDDGRLAYKVTSDYWRESGGVVQATNQLDYIPNIGLAAGLTP